MKKRSPVGRFMLYAALGGCTVIFVFPLLWMFVTSLMPIDQATASPPHLIPRAYYTNIDGQRVEITLDFKVEQPGVLVEFASGMRKGERFILGDDFYDPKDTTLTFLHRVEPGWWQVTERSRTSKTVQSSLRRDVVPRDAIHSTIKFRWSNYPRALAAMGGLSVDEAEGTVKMTHEGVDANVGFPAFLFNTLLVCVLGAIGTVLSNAIVAYGFARLKWRGRDTFFAVTISTMMIPFPVLMVPLYAIFKELGWIGTLLPLWVPAFFGSAFNIFLMRQFFRTIPEELSEAARMDGCSEWRIFWRIILPLSKPVLSVAALFHFLWAWNDFLGPLIFLTRKHTFTLALALQNYQTQHGGVQWHYLMAASTVVVIPIIVLFFFTQKTFIQGIATTGSKS